MESIEYVVLFALDVIATVVGIFVCPAIGVHSNRGVDALPIPDLPLLQEGTLS